MKTCSFVVGWTIGFLFLLPGDAPGQTLLHTFSGDGAGDDFGYALTFAGDVNGDGVNDLIVGARGDDNNGSGSGMTRVLSGADGAVLYSFDGDSTSDDFGESVGGGSDVNGDGFLDVIAGAPDDDDNGSNSGSVRVHSGFDGAILYTFLGGTNGDEMGFSCAGGGDFDQDGFDDVIGGARRADPNGSASGMARVYSGQLGTVLYTFPGDSAGDQAGYSVATAGDVNNDSVPDVVVGIYRDDNTANDAGSARVYSGVNGSILHTLDGDSSGDLLGWRVAGAGDVDNDGHAEIIAGAPFHSEPSGSVCGRAKVFSGATGAVLHAFDGDDPGDQLGTAVGGGFDLNGDGILDYLVGADHDSEPVNNVGSVSIYSGVDGTLLSRFYGDGTSDQLGFAVAGLGDLDGDGLPDFAVGSADAGGTGQAYVWGGCEGSIKHYGEGCPGTGFFTPRLVVDGCPTTGGAVTLTLRDGLGGSSALLLFGIAEGAVPIGGGCELSMTPPLLPLVIPLTLPGAGAGAGAVSFGAALPPIPVPLVVTLQGFVADPAVSIGFTASNAARLLLQP